MQKEIIKDKIIVYRFIGKTSDNLRFYIQIKEDKMKKHKFFLSVFSFDK